MTTTPDYFELQDKIEKAIKYAAELGKEGAFDYIEGRGLYIHRLEIAEELVNLYSLLYDYAFKIHFLLDNHIPCEDGIYMFPDGDSWETTNILVDTKKEQQNTVQALIKEQELLDGLQGVKI